MSLGGAEIDVVQEALGEFVVLFAVVTQLGSVWFYFTVLGAWYWFGPRMPVLGGGFDRPRAARLVAIAIGAMALVVGLKGLFAVERPPGADTPVGIEHVPALLHPLYEEAATADGFGFPSGHALGSTAVWGAAAWLYRGGNRRRRVALAAAIAVLVSFSRIAIGVHRAVDVLAGIAIAVVYLAVAVRVETPARTFGLAAALAVGAVLATGAHPEAVAILGFALGGLGTWLAVGAYVPVRPTSVRQGALTTVVGVVLTGPLFLATVAVDAHPLVLLGVGALAMAAVLALPVLLGGRLEERESLGELSG